MYFPIGVLCTDKMFTPSTSKEIVPWDFVLEFGRALLKFIWKIIMVSACIHQSSPEKQNQKVYMIYYKELTHVIVEANKSPDSHSASWRLGKPMVVTIGNFAGSRPRKNQCVSPKA